MTRRAVAEARRAAAMLLGSAGGQATMARLSPVERRALAKRGGKARARSLSKARRREISLIANRARWARYGKGRG
jgi:hypothetical protein